ncbi:hypothetical protein OC844_007834, partial [Tilletia horrida]
FSGSHSRVSSTAGASVDGGGSNGLGGGGSSAGLSSSTTSPQLGGTSEYATAPSSPDVNGMGSVRGRKKSIFGKIKNAFASPSSSPTKSSAAK